MMGFENFIFEACSIHVIFCVLLERYQCHASEIEESILGSISCIHTHFFCPSLLLQPSPCAHKTPGPEPRPFNIRIPRYPHIPLPASEPS